MKAADSQSQDPVSKRTEIQSHVFCAEIAARSFENLFFFFKENDIRLISPTIYFFLLKSIVIMFANYIKTAFMPNICSTIC